MAKFTCTNFPFKPDSSAFEKYRTNLQEEMMKKKKNAQAT
jgi:hypothetical protein